MASNPSEAIATMSRVIFALVLRETKTRYGRLRVGYLWAFVEPIMFIAILTWIFSLRRSSPAELPAILFYATGVLPFLMFRNIVTQTMTATRANFQLLTFPQVQIPDLGLARTILEVATFITVFALMMGGIQYLELAAISIENPIGLFCAVLLIASLAYGFGTAAAAIASVFPTVEFIIQALLLRPLFFISGVFFLVETLPVEIRRFALLNPMLQLIEMFRADFFTEFDSQYVDVTYILGFSLATVALGLLLQRALRKHAFDL